MSNIDYSTATAGELARALRKGKVSALELADTAISRIEALDGPINAVVVRDFEHARSAARIADKRLSKGERAPLLGVPMTVKESYDLKGFPSTWGLERLANHKAEEDAVVVQRLKGAGAILLGKTNVPPNLADWQSDNPVYGRTNNPHALTHSPGGSSGGGAAAVAAGFVPLEIGGDIGGSIRIPATFCGIYGHKTSYGIVPMTGHTLGGGRSARGALSVGGPLARSADDLDLALGVIAGPDGDNAKGFRLDLPPPRYKKLSDYKVLVIDAHPRTATSNEVKSALSLLAADLENAGATVARKSDLLPDLAIYHKVYIKMLRTVVTRRDPDARPPISAHEWMDLLDVQADYRRQWAALFETYDAVIAPAFGTSSFPHTSIPEWRDRSLMIDGEVTPYGDQLAWQGPAILGHLPSTAMPLGKSSEGLPIGAQIMGGFLEDRTTIALAGLIGSR
jgi:amidase